MLTRSKILGLTFILLLTLAGAHTASATFRRPAGAYLFGPEVIWTDGTGTEVFHPLSDPMPSANLAYARVQFEVSEATGTTNLRAKSALRYSPDGVNWDTAQPINSTPLQGSGIQPGTTFVDLTALAGVTPKAWVQFGVLAKNNSGSTYELALAALLVEPMTQ